MAGIPLDRLGSFIGGTYSNPSSDRLVEELQSDIPVAGLDPRVLRAIVACKSGARPAGVAAHLGWQEFERFCAAVFRARGYDVRENLVLRKPRAQIDLLARSTSVALAVDCKHWARERGPSAMMGIASAQAERARLLRAKMPELEPLAAVILVLSNEQTRFAGGAAVVPIETLGHFLSSLPDYYGMLAFE